MKRLLLSVFFAAGLAFASEYRTGPLHVITIQAQNYGLPGIPEPPFRAEWFQVLISTDTPGIAGFRVTVRFREGSETRTSTLAAPVLEGLKYTWLQFPGKLDVISITVEELRAEPSIEIRP